MNDIETSPNPATRSRRRALKLVQACLILGGVVWMIVGVTYLRLAIVERGWPIADALVTDVTVTKERRFSGSTGHGDPFYWAVQTNYSYVVDGQTFSGTYFRTGELTIDYTNRPSAEARAAEIRAAGRIPIHYDPEDPGVAVMEPQEITAFVPILFGLGWVVVGVWLARRYPVWFQR